MSSILNGSSPPASPNPPSFNYSDIPAGDDIRPPASFSVSPSPSVTGGVQNVFSKRPSSEALSYAALLARRRKFNPESEEKLVAFAKVRSVL